MFDVYLRNSIKVSIRSKRGSGQQVAVTTSTQIPQNWSEFLRNKTALFALVQKHVVTAVDPHLATVVVTSFDTVLSNDTLDLSYISPCDHEEADTRMFLHVNHAKSESIIRTVDTNVVVIAIYCFHNLGINRL